MVIITSDVTNSWMSLCGNTIGYKNLSQIVIPGSHNSGSYSCNGSYGLSPEYPGPSWMYYFTNIVKRWTVDQEFNIYHQLLSGIRCLDLRVAIQTTQDNIQYRVHHGYYGETLTNIMSQIERFYQQHPKEFVIINFRHFIKPGNLSGSHTHSSQWSPEDHIRFYTKVIQPLEHIIIKSKHCYHTLDSLWDKKPRLVIVYGDNRDSYTSSIISSDCLESSRKYLVNGYSNFCDLWPNKSTPSSVYRWLSTKLDSQGLKYQGFLQCQLLTTATKNKIILGLLFPCFYPSCTRIEAQCMARSNMIWCRENSYRINIILLDWTTTQSIVDIIKFNQSPIFQTSI